MNHGQRPSKAFHWRRGKGSVDLLPANRLAQRRAIPNTLRRHNTPGQTAKRPNSTAYWGSACQGHLQLCYFSCAELYLIRWAHGWAGRRLVECPSPFALGPRAAICAREWHGRGSREEGQQHCNVLLQRVPLQFRCSSVAVPLQLQKSGAPNVRCSIRNNGRILQRTATAIVQRTSSAMGMDGQLPDHRAVRSEKRP
jgi:hypothetical protein